jgi:alkylation response protein AidB-like acyl-CoA dehydrogenase
MTTTDLHAEQFADPAAYAEAFTRFLETDPRVEPHRGAHAESLEEEFAAGLRLQQVLYGEGWSRLGWPAAFGGLGGSSLFRAAMFETLVAQGIAIPAQYTTLETLVPVMVTYAPELAEQHLVPLLEGTDVWSQAFSEPDAGSDLASLRTRMTPDGDGWRLSGQKTWSSYGHVAQRSVLLARSGEAGHRGLTMVLIDLDQPGVEVRSIRCQDGENHVSEIFLDDAWLPGDRVIGQLGAGWAMAMYMLQWERGAWGWIQQNRFFNRLTFALQRGGGDSSGDASLGRAYADTVALRLYGRNTVHALAEDQSLGARSSIDKLLLADAELGVWDAVRHELGARFELSGDLDWLRTEFLFSRAAPIYGGSQEIQRMLVAQRVLGMPKEA